MCICCDLFLNVEHNSETFRETRKDFSEEEVCPFAVILSVYSSCNSILEKRQNMKLKYRKV